MGSTRLALIVFASLVAGCSSADFGVAPSQGSDTGAGADGTTGDTGTLGDVDLPDVDDSGSTSTDGSIGDTGVVGPDANPPADSGSSDGIVSTDAITACSTIPSNAPDLYVDQRSTKPSVGGSDCPFHTILEATSQSWSGAGTRTIHVAGTAAGLTYNETDVIDVKNAVHLLGDGAANVTIKGGGTCNGTGAACVVQVETGGILEGVTVAPGNATGIVTMHGAPTPNVNHVTVTGGTGKMPAVNVLGSADLGPAIRVVQNTFATGVLVGATAGTVHVIAGGGNAFDNNATGIDVTGGAILNFEGGTASSNTAAGIHLANTASSSGTYKPHTVSSLVARDNGGNGVFVGVNASLVLRGSVLLHNRIGLTMEGASTNSIDLGTATSLGGNTFATVADPSNPDNIAAAICIDSPPPVIAGEGDYYSVCPVVPIAGGPCESVGASTTYVGDVVYHAASGGTPPSFDSNTCKQGS